MWGKGKKYGTFSVVLEHGGAASKFLSVWTDDSVSVWFKDMEVHPAFEDESRRSEVLRRMNEVPAVNFPADAIEKYPYTRLTNLVAEPDLEKFLEALDWFVKKVKAT